MKKLSVLFALLAVAMFAKAEVGSLDFTANDITVAPGGEASLTIAASDANMLEYIFNWQCELVLPEGFYVPAGDKGNYTHKVWDDDDEKYYDVFMYETPSNKSKHETQAAIQSDGALKIVTAVASYTSLRTTKQGKLVILTIKAEDGVAPGTYQGIIRNGLFSGGVVAEDAEGKPYLSETVDIKPAELSFTITVSGATETTITFTMTAAGYGTLILPFEAEVPEGLKAYTCAEAEGNVLTLVEATTLAANAPYIMEGAEGTYEFTGTPENDAVSYTVGLLTGLLEAGKAPVGSYVLQNQAKGVGFYKVTSEKDVNANRCYLNMPASGALMYRIGGTTNIEEITVDDNAEVYDVLGRKVLGPLQKGVYIKDGHKIYVK